METGVLNKPAPEAAAPDAVYGKCAERVLQQTEGREHCQGGESEDAGGENVPWCTWLAVNVLKPPGPGELHGG